MALLFESRIGIQTNVAGLSVVAVLTFLSLTIACGVELVDAAPPVRDAESNSNARLKEPVFRAGAAKLAGYGVIGAGEGVGVLAVTCEASDPVLSEPSVVDLGYGTRIRYLGWSDGTPNGLESARVRFTGEDGEQQTMWVGMPYILWPCGEPCGPIPVVRASLTCEPVATDWTAFDSVFVLGPSVVPGKDYEIALVLAGCELEDAAYTTKPTVITTSAWGDIVSTCYDELCGSPDGDADFDDISAAVDTFKHLYGEFMRIRADVMPEVLDLKVDFGDIPAIVDAFRGLPYPYTPPADPCP